MRREKYSLYVIILSSVLTIVLSIGLNIVLIDRSAKMAEKTRKQSDRQQCELYRSMINAYADSPPETETGKSIAENWRTQYDALSCATTLMPD